MGEHSPLAKKVMINRARTKRDQELEQKSLELYNLVKARYEKPHDKELKREVKQKKKEYDRAYDTNEFLNNIGKGKKLKGGITRKQFTRLAQDYADRGLFIPLDENMEPTEDKNVTRSARISMSFEAQDRFLRDLIALLKPEEEDLRMRMREMVGDRSESRYDTFLQTLWGLIANTPASTPAQSRRSSAAPTPTRPRREEEYQEVEIPEMGSLSIAEETPQETTEAEETRGPSSPFIEARVRAIINNSRGRLTEAQARERALRGGDNNMDLYNALREINEGMIPLMKSHDSWHINLAQYVQHLMDQANQAILRGNPLVLPDIVRVARELVKIDKQIHSDNGQVRLDGYNKLTDIIQEDIIQAVYLSRRHPTNLSRGTVVESDLKKSPLYESIRDTYTKIRTVVKEAWRVHRQLTREQEHSLADKVETVVKDLAELNTQGFQQATDIVTHNRPESDPAREREEIDDSMREISNLIDRWKLTGKKRDVLNDILVKYDKAVGLTTYWDQDQNYIQTDGLQFGDEWLREATGKQSHSADLIMALMTNVRNMLVDEMPQVRIRTAPVTEVPSDYESPEQYSFESVQEEELPPLEEAPAEEDSSTGEPSPKRRRGGATRREVLRLAQHAQSLIERHERTLDMDDARSVDRINRLLGILETIMNGHARGTDQDRDVAVRDLRAFITELTPLAPEIPIVTPRTRQRHEMEQRDERPTEEKESPVSTYSTSESQPPTPKRLDFDSKRRKRGGVSPEAQKVFRDNVAKARRLIDESGVDENTKTMWGFMLKRREQQGEQMITENRADGSMEPVHDSLINFIETIMKAESSKRKRAASPPVSLSRAKVMRRQESPQPLQFLEKDMVRDPTTNRKGYLNKDKTDVIWMEDEYPDLESDYEGDTTPTELLYSVYSSDEDPERMKGGDIENQLPEPEVVESPEVLLAKAEKDDALARKIISFIAENAMLVASNYDDPYGLLAKFGTKELVKKVSNYFFHKTRLGKGIEGAVRAFLVFVISRMRKVFGGVLDNPLDKDGFVMLVRHYFPDVDVEHGDPIVTQKRQLSKFLTDVYGRLSPSQEPLKAYMKQHWREVDFLRDILEKLPAKGVQSRVVHTLRHPPKKPDYLIMTNPDGSKSIATRVQE